MACVGGEFGEVFVDAQARVRGGLVVFRRDAVLGEPAEDVAHAGLACLVAPEPVHDAAVHHAAHAGHFAQLGAVHHVAGGGAHDGHQLARVPRPWRPGAVTWASTLPTATAMPSGSPVQAAASAVR